MTFGRYLLGVVVVFCIPTWSFSAELRTLKGETIQGDLVSISDQTLVMSVAGKEVQTPMSEVLHLEVNRVTPPTKGTEYHDVELTDGTIVHCSSFVIKGKNAHFKPLLTGQEVTLPLKLISNFLKPAHEEKFRNDWDDRVSGKGTRDILAVFKEGVVNALEGTLGNGDDEGKKIAFRLTSGNEVQVTAANAHGFIWQHSADPNAPAIEFRLHDTHGNIVMGANIATETDGVVVTTPAGAKLKYKFDQIGKLDFSKGKLTFLSDVRPVHKVLMEYSTGKPKFGHMKLDRSLDGRQGYVLQGQNYPKGLAMYTYTELEYDLDGEYEEFRAVVGIDEQVGGSDGAIRLVVEADGKPIVDMTLRREDEVKVHDITRNIKDVDRIRIIVSDTDMVDDRVPVDIGKHLTLANAQVRKAPEDN